MTFTLERQDTDATRRDLGEEFCMISKVRLVNGLGAILLALVVGCARAPEAPPTTAPAPAAKPAQTTVPAAAPAATTAPAAAATTAPAAAPAATTAPAAP